MCSKHLESGANLNGKGGETRPRRYLAFSSSSSRRDVFHAWRRQRKDPAQRTEQNVHSDVGRKMAVQLLLSTLKPEVLYTRHVGTGQRTPGGFM